MSLSTSFQNFFNLIRYSIVYQILYFLTLPVLLTQYDSSSFGLFSIIFSVASILGIISALMLERAIVVEQFDKIRSILIHCGSYVTIFSIITSFVTWLTLKPLENVDSETGILVLLGGLYCLIYGCIQVLLHLAIRENKVTLTGISDVTYSGLLLLLLLTLRVDSISQELLLLVVYTIARLVSVIPYCKLNLRQYFKVQHPISITFKELYPYYFPVGTAFISNLQFRGLFYLTGVYYNVSVTGNLSMAQRILYAPVNLIGSTLRKSFFLEFTKKGDSFEELNSDVSKVLKNGSVISVIILPFFLVTIYLLQDYIPTEWNQIPAFGIALYPVASILVLLSWLDRVYDAKKQQILALKYEICYTIILYLFLMVALFCGVEAITLMLAYTTITVSYNLIWAFLTLRMLNTNKSVLLPLVTAHLFILITVIIYLL